MAVLSRIQGVFRRPVPADVTGTSVVEPTIDEEKKEAATAAVVNGSEESQTERPNDDLQRGVEQVEAVTLSWSKASLIFVFLKYVPTPLRVAQRGASG